MAPGVMSCLPFLQIVLFCLILLYKIVKDLLQPVRIGLEGGHHVFDRPLHEDAIDHAEALSISRERL